MVIEGNWNEEFLRILSPDEIVDHIVEKISPPNSFELEDKAF